MDIQKTTPPVTIDVDAAILNSDASCSRNSTNHQFEPIDKTLHHELTNIIWGSDLKEDVFYRWSQGLFLV